MKARIFFLALILTSVTASASHKIAGLELTYERTAPGKFDIFIHMVRHCDGASLTAEDLILSCSSSTVTIPASQQTLVSTKKLNNCQSTPCNGVGNYEEKVWKAQVDLSASSCCDWTVQYANDFREVGGYYFVQASLNKCVTSNTGGHFVQIPQVILSYNQDMALNFSFESVDPTDSVSYELVTGLNGINQSITYSGNFSPVRPMTFFGFPNQNLQYPAGFRLGQDGFLRFRPTSPNQVATLVVEVKIWRKVNGQFQVVGKVMRDIEVTVLTMPNSAAPSIAALNSGMQNVFLCKEDTSAVRWQSADADGDSTFIEIIHADSGIQLSTDYDQGKQVRLSAWIDTALFNASPTKTFTLLFWLRDNSCPYPRSRLYTLTLRQARKPTAQFTQSVQCRQINTSIAVTDSVNSFFRARYSFYDSYNNLLGSSNNGLFNSSNLPLGVSTLKMGYGFQGACSIDTSITLNILPGFKFALSGPNSGCEGDSLRLELVDQGSVGNYTYQWKNLTTPSTPYLVDSLNVARVFPKYSALYEVKAIDSAACFLTYSMYVNLMLKPQYTLDRSVFVCPGNTWPIGPVNIQFATNKIWLNGDTIFPRIEKNVGWYLFKLENQACKILDSAYLGHFKLPVLGNLPSDSTFCANGSLKLSASKGLSPYSFYWNGTPTHSMPAITKSEFVTIKVVDQNACVDSAQISIWLSERPNLNFFPGTMIELCEKDSVLLTVGNIPQKANYVWMDSLASLTRIIYAGSINILMLTDSSGCLYNYPVYTVPWPNPDPGFSYSVVSGGIAFTPVRLNANHMWTFGDGKYSNNGLPVHKYDLPGTYTVTHFLSEQEHGCHASESLEIVVVGLSELERLGIRMYPNPFMHDFTIDSPAETKISAIQLFDMSGREIILQTKQSENQVQVYALENLTSGTYILRIWSEQGVFETRVQKQ